MMFALPAPPKTLAWADRLYAPIDGRACELPGQQAREALEAYRAIARRYPGELRAHRGAARCLFRMGRYRAAAAEFRAGQGTAAEIANAVTFAKMAERIQDDLFPGYSVVHLVRPAPATWIAVTAEIVTDEASDEPFQEVSLRPYREREGRFSPAGEPVPVRTDRGDCQDLDVFAPAWMPGRFFLQPAYMAASCVPNSVYCVDVRGGQIKVSPPLHSLSTTRIWRENGDVWMVVTPTYKVWWYDVYRLRDGQAIFANHRRPDLYRGSEDRPSGDNRFAYHAWMRYAAMLTIERRRDEAISAWREAQRCAAGAVWEQGHGVDRDRARYPDYGMYGDARENLREIRQRLTWLRRNDWNHWLLYRPYDWGLQVWPGRLGRAIPEGFEEW